MAETFKKQLEDARKLPECELFLMNVDNVDSGPQSGPEFSDLATDTARPSRQSKSTLSPGKVQPNLSVACDSKNDVKAKVQDWKGLVKGSIEGLMTSLGKTEQKTTTRPNGPNWKTILESLSTEGSEVPL